MTGNTLKQWFSFWMDPILNGKWIREAEIDALEHMPNSPLTAHNFDGMGRQTKFKPANKNKGHVTVWITD